MWQPTSAIGNDSKGIAVIFYGCQSSIGPSLLIGQPYPTQTRRSAISGVAHRNSKIYPSPENVCTRLASDATSPSIPGQSETSLSYLPYGMYSNNVPILNNDEGFVLPLHKEIRRLIRQWDNTGAGEGMEKKRLVLRLQSTYACDTVRFVSHLFAKCVVFLEF